MWSCTECAPILRLRMYWALSGISSPSAFSTERTEASAWTVVQTPQNRCVNAQASRGSRPFRMTSTPRHIVPDDQALVTFPPSTSHSIRRWPSIRVTGSIAILLAISLLSSLLAVLGVLRRGQHGQILHEDQVDQELDGDDRQRDQDFLDRGEVGPPRARLEADDVHVELQHAAGEQQHEAGGAEVLRACALRGGGQHRQRR